MTTRCSTRLFLAATMLFGACLITLDDVSAQNRRSRNPAFQVIEDDATFAPWFYRFYERVDQLIGNLVDRIPRDVALFVVSDHGFCTLKKEVHLNHWLKEAGMGRCLTSLHGHTPSPKIGAGSDRCPTSIGSRPGRLARQRRAISSGPSSSALAR